MCVSTATRSKTSTDRLARVFPRTFSKKPQVIVRRVVKVQVKASLPPHLQPPRVRQAAHPSPPPRPMPPNR